jgi:hypothetical protein
VSSERPPRKACTASLSFNLRSAEETMVQLYIDACTIQMIGSGSLFAITIHLGRAGICRIRTLECTLEISI